MIQNISGVILAGGVAKRFGGTTKANIVIEGKTIISRIIESIGSIFDEIIIVTNTPDEFGSYRDCKIAGDIFLNAGPIGGLHSALKNSSKEAIFVFAGDMPFLDRNLISDQIEHYQKGKYDILIPKIDNRIEPLHAIYNCSITEKLEFWLQDNQKKGVRDFFEFVNAGYMELNDSEENRIAFTNINSPSDIDFY